MQYLLLLLLPPAIAAGCWVLRRHARLVAGIGALAALVELVLVMLTRVDEPARLLGATIALSGFEQLMLAAMLVLAAGSMFLFVAEPPGANAVPATLLALGFIVATALLETTFAATLALFAAGLIGIFVVVDVPVGSSALLRPSLLAVALKYLLQLSLGAILLLAGLGLTETAAGSSPVGLGLLLAGFGLLLGLLPFNVAAGDLAEESSPQVFAAVVGLLQPAALLLLLGTLQAQPSLLRGTGRPLGLGLAALTAVAAPLLARGSARRVTALLFCGNAGLIVLGLLLGSEAGGRAALLGAVGHTLAFALVCLSAGLLERRVPGRREDDGPGRARPQAALGLVAGLLALVGVPPWAGWPGKALLWQAAAERGPAMLALVVVAHLGLAAGALRLARSLLGSAPHASVVRPAELAFTDVMGEGEGPPVVGPGYAPLVVRAALLLVLMLALALGVYPDPLVAPVERTLAGLNSIWAAGAPR